MADVPISALPATAAAATTQIFPVVTAGVTEKETIAQLIALLLPPGIIIMWSGSLLAIPSGWALCNGAGGTPDLRGNFIVGAGNAYNVGDTGGADTHTHTEGTPDNNVGATAGGDVNAGSDTHVHLIDSASNLPPFYALAFIIKL